MPDKKTKTQSTSKDYKPSDEEEELIKKWKKRFKQAKEFREPYRKKWLRMYQLYRAYQEKKNYAYKTRLMPPIAFEIIETLVSRLATAKRKTRVIPREKKDLQSKSLDSWDDLVNYDFDIIKLKKKLPLWLRPAGMYGNGIAQVVWRTDEVNNYDDPELHILDLWDILIAPETTDLQEDCPWLIKRILKTKEKIEKDEEARGDNKIYKNLEFVENKKVDDWKKERYEINAKKMGQIAGDTETNKDEGEALSEKSEDEKKAELWECYDFEEQKLITFANQEIVIRDDEDPYKNVNNGKIFIDLPDHPLNWEFWAMGHLEPVETTILEIADLRNQRMDDVVLMLDPVTKIRKDAGVDKNKIIFEPGAQWELRRPDDVVIERPPEISQMGIAEDKLMREEIERTLALSEYMQGVPHGKQEPAAKVAMLLGQGNLRLGLNASNVSEALTNLANILIELNREFISKDKLYRIVGDEVSFKEFTKKDKEIKVDAIVEVEPVIPQVKEAKVNQVLMLYDKLVNEDKPDPQNEEEVKQWRKRKRELQKMLLEELGKEAYEEVLLGKEEEEIPPKKEAEKTTPPTPRKVKPPMEPTSPAPQPGIIDRLMAKIPILGRFGD